VSVIEPSFSIKRRNGKQTGGHRLALRASLRPQLELWLGLADPDHQSTLTTRRENIKTRSARLEESSKEEKPDWTHLEGYRLNTPSSHHRLSTRGVIVVAQQKE